MTMIGGTRPRTLSKSDYTLARTCEAKLYFRENKYPDSRDDDPYLRMLACGGYMVEALAKAHYPGAVQLEYGKDPQRDFQKTMEQLSRGNVTVFEATLLWNRRMARADIVQKTGNTIRLLEVKAKSFDGKEHAESLASGGQGCFRNKRKPYGIASKWERYFEDVTYQTLLLERLFPDCKVEPYLVLVDTSKRAQMDDIPRLFEIERQVDERGVERVHTAHFRGDRALLPKMDVLTTVDVAAEVALLRKDVEEAASRFESLLDEPRESFEPAYGPICAKCEFRTDDPLALNGFRDCWGELADVKPHVLEMFSIGTVKAGDESPMIEWLVRAGKASLLDIPEERLVKTDGTVGPQAERQRRQLSCTKSGVAWHSDALRQKTQALSYPLHFIDFEAARLALPYHAGMRPYGQVAFQWSCHTVESPGARPVHREWLNADERWPNGDFVRTLRDAIGDDGPILTWSSFEKSALREVAGDLARFDLDDPKLAAWIGDSCDRRIVDLHQWAQQDYYHPDMRGRTSIKVVLDALWRCDEQMRARFETLTGLKADPTIDPYASLPGIEINGIMQDVVEGTGAIRAYEAMMYGVERDMPGVKSAWRELLLQYCKLDTLSMILIFEHWRQVAGDGARDR